MVQLHQSHFLSYSASHPLPLQVLNVHNATYTDVSFICFLLPFTHFTAVCETNGTHRIFLWHQYPKKEILCNCSVSYLAVSSLYLNKYHLHDKE